MTAPRTPRRRKPPAAPAEPALKTVSVPEPFQAPFLRAQEFVSRYFREQVQNPELGVLTISGERYILLRAASMSVEFFDLVTSLYKDKGPEVARGVASNLLFDLAHAIGKADAHTFHQRMGVTDPIERLSAGPIHFSFSGWAFVKIFPESRPSPDEEFFLIYDHPFSFESDAWRRRDRRSEYPVCVMNAGYSSGWCEESFGLPLVAVEISCLAAGGPQCRFIMAPPSRIEGHLARHARANGGGGKVGARGAPGPVSIPEFFQRKRMEDELRASHQNLEARVQERTLELMEANERLRLEVAERQRAEEARDEFLSVAAHELKTPLTSLRGFAQLLVEQIEAGTMPDPQRLRLAASAIDQQSRKLSRLVSQLLDVSRIQAGALVIERQATDVVKIVREVVEAIRAGARRHELLLKAPARVPAVVDPFRLEQVITNLIDNALKFSPDGGRVETEVSRVGSTVRIAVTDHGVGIPPEHRAHIFDRFYQAQTHHRLAGMGLGLYISRQIVDLHGGRISAEFPPEGGTRFVVLLPEAPTGP